MNKNILARILSGIAVALSGYTLWFQITNTEGGEALFSKFADEHMFSLITLPIIFLLLINYLVQRNKEDSKYLGMATILLLLAVPFMLFGMYQETMMLIELKANM